MPYVPGYEHDIFVSYAHVDDSVDPGVDTGWVTNLVRILRNRLAALGLRDNYSMWMDHELSSHKPITSELLRELENTALLLVILSPGYVASEWCSREKDTFLKQIQQRIAGDSRVFIVERLPLDQERRPTEFSDLLGYRFWISEGEGRAPRALGEPDLREKPFLAMLNDLSRDIAKQLEALRKLSDVEQKPTEPQYTETVFIAEVTDDLEDLRNQTKRFLNQAGIRVLPELYYPRDPERFRAAMEKDLVKCKLFVQLLSAIGGKKSVDLEQGLIVYQAQVAREAGCDMLQWRGADIDLEAVADTEHRKLLESEHVIAMGHEEFKHEIVERARRTTKKREKPINAFCFVDMEQSDRSLAEAVCAELDKRGAGYALPMREGKPSEIRADLRSNLLDCDALVIIYGSSPLSWVREQLHLARRILYEREQPLKVLGIYEGPPNQKAAIDYRLPNVEMISIDGRKGLSDTEVDRFLDSIGDKDEPQ